MSALSEKTCRELRAIRDTVESIWVAIVLAFVLRAFLIEAFVIPTGSMAPRLLGEHWDLRCPVCGWEYAYGLRKESTQASERNEEVRPGDEVECPNCWSPDNRPSYVNGGDRVLVLKYLYRFREPQPWDVVVFRNPQNNRENYIKRLIGLPGETIQIVHGDIFVKASPDAPWEIRRKPILAQEAMWQIVFDNDYRPSQELIDQGVAPSWVPQEHPDRWKLSDDHGRLLKFLGSREPAGLKLKANPKEFWPRYGYNPPETGGGTINSEMDVCTDLKLSVAFIPRSDDAQVALHLTSFEHQFQAQVHRDGTVALLHKLDGQGGAGWQTWGQTKLAPLQLGRGRKITLSHADFRVRVWVNDTIVLESTDQQYGPDFPALLKHVTIRWAIWDTERKLQEIEDQLRQPDDSGQGTPHARDVSDLDARKRQLESLKIQQEADAKRWLPFPTPEVRISAQGGPCDLRHVALHRDVYYTATSFERYGGKTLRDLHERDLFPRGNSGSEIAPGAILLQYAVKMKDDPKRQGPNHWVFGPNGEYVAWGVAPDPITLAKHPDDRDLDEFFVLGDNSPQSLDGRAWVKAAPSLRLYDSKGQCQYQLGTVPRYNMIGKAFFVYWPAGFRVPGLPGLSIIPNVGKMRMIR